MKQSYRGLLIATGILQILTSYFFAYYFVCVIVIIGALSGGTAISFPMLLLSYLIVGLCVIIINILSIMYFFKKTKKLPLIIINMVIMAIGLVLSFTQGAGVFFSIVAIFFLILLTIALVLVLKSRKYDAKVAEFNNGQKIDITLGNNEQANEKDVLSENENNQQ